jgi:hypothetical protein
MLAAFSLTALVLAAPGPSLVLSGVGAPSPRPAVAPPGMAAPLSAAGEQLLWEVIQDGQLRDHPLARMVLESVALQQAATAGIERPALAPSRAHWTQDLATDVLVNDRGGVTSCGACPNGNLSQAETSIAAHEAHLLASWNDNKARCLGLGTQGLGYSLDVGGTWTDLGSVPFTAEGSQYRGDPVVAVNRRTGDFYVTGLDRAGNSGTTGIATLRAHFEGGTLVVDANHRTAVAATGDFLDKPWMTVDSLSGNVYVTWTNFTAGTSQIELQRLDAALVPLGSLQVLDTGAGLQGTFPSVGPNGELYVPWTRYRYPKFDPTPSALLVRRSDDFGASFGPVAKIADIEINSFSGAPGSRRQFGTANIAMAVDASLGPHRGRVYALWDECVHFHDAPFGAHTAAFEQENNGFFASAQTFVPGGKLRGSIDPGAEVDFWKFDATAGQTLVIRPDTLISPSVQFPIRMVCASDTTSLGTYHILAFAVTDPASGGMVCTLPTTGTYYLMCGGPGSTTIPIGYVLSTAFDTPTPGERARDARDQFVSYSDDGTTWSSPLMVNDDPPGRDGCFPAVAVDDLGRVHAFFFNFRNGGACGDLSDQYLTSSGDGGVTWGANRRLTDVSSYWGFLASCSNANHGDYQQIAADGVRLYACFPDARLGDPDVFVDATIQDSHGQCPASLEAPAGGDVDLPFALVNDGSVATLLSWALEDTRGWLTGAIPASSGTQTISASGGSLAILASFHLPDGCVGDSTVARLITSDPHIPGHSDTCVTAVRCVSPVSVDHPIAPALDLEAPLQNPAPGILRVAFTLPGEGRATLALVDLAGRQRVAREVGSLGRGRHVVSLTDAEILPSGMYWLRLSRSERSLVRPAIMLR